MFALDVVAQTVVAGAVESLGKMNAMLAVLVIINPTRPISRGPEDHQTVSEMVDSVPAGVDVLEGKLIQNHVFKVSICEKKKHTFFDLR